MMMKYEDILEEIIHQVGNYRSQFGKEPNQIIIGSIVLEILKCQNEIILLKTNHSYRVTIYGIPTVVDYVNGFVLQVGYMETVQLKEESD